MEYYRILSTIKNTFRQLFGPNVDIFKINNPFIPFHLSLILKDKRGCKSLCYLLASFKEPKSIIRWESKLNVYFLRDDWKMFYLIPFNCTMDTKLRWFQYRILNRFLTTNSFMCKIGQRIDNVCTFCKKEAETIEHLFVECKVVTNIWFKLQNWIQIKLSIPVVLSKTHILFGIDLKKCNSTINLIILLSKFYIYRIRCQGSTLSFLALQREIESYYKLEKYILLKTLNLSNFKIKWQVWKGLFDWRVAFDIRDIKLLIFSSQHYYLHLYEKIFVFPMSIICILLLSYVRIYVWVWGEWKSLCMLLKKPVYM